MSETRWTDLQVDRHLRSLSYADVLPDAPALSPELAARALAARGRSRASARWKIATAAAVVAGLLLVGSNPSVVADVVHRILGIPVRTMTTEEYRRQASGDWAKDMPMPAYAPPEETARLATFPLRSPAWVPEGFEVLREPQGAYEWVRTEEGEWRLEEDPAYFYVSQSYESADGRRIFIRQSLLRNGQWVAWPPGTEQLEVAGHPAFLRRDVEPIVVKPPEWADSTADWLPESLNMLHVWVAEPDGRTTEIVVDGDVEPEVLIQVAASMFTGDGQGN